MTLRTTALLAAISTVALGVPAPAEADTYSLTIAAGQPPRPLPSLAQVRDYFVPEVNKRLKAAGSEHEIRFKEAYAGSLLKPTKVLQGVQDGIADIGYVPTLFHPDKLPLEQVSFMAPFCTTDLSIVTTAMEKLHQKVPEMPAQYAEFNQVRLAGTGVDSYQLLTDFRIEKVEDLDGKKIGAAGASLAWLRGTGVTPVQSNMMEYYNSTKTGVYDGFIVMASTMPGMKYPEVAPYVTKADFGAMYAVTLTMNLDSLDRLPQQVREVLLAVGKDYGNVADQAYMEAGDSGYEVLPKYDGKRYDLPRSEQVKWAKAMPNIAQEWATRLDEQGLPGTEVLNKFMASLREAGVECARQWDKE